jgi:hypothetical protein
MQTPDNHEASRGDREQTLSLFNLNQRIAAQQQQQQQSSSSFYDLFTNQRNQQGAAAGYFRNSLNLPSISSSCGGSSSGSSVLSNHSQLLYANALNQLTSSTRAGAGLAGTSSAQSQVQRNLPENFTLAESLAALQRPVPTGTRSAIETAILRENAMMRQQLLLAGLGSASAGGVGGDVTRLSLASPYGSLLSSASRQQLGDSLVERTLERRLLSDSTLPGNSSRLSVGSGTGLVGMLGRPTPPSHLRSGQSQQHQELTGISNGRNFPTCLPCVLTVPEDNHKLSSHQVLLRNQIEVFHASEDDLSTHKRGRNKPIKLGQVGIRCKWCSRLPVARRQKGSAYFPASLHGVYQAAVCIIYAHAH